MCFACLLAVLYVCVNACVCFLACAFGRSLSRPRSLSAGNLDASDTAEKIGTVIDDHMAK